jgi:hypothetical protein
LIINCFSSIKTEVESKSLICASIYYFSLIAISVVSWQTWSLIGLQNRGEEGRGFWHIIVLILNLGPPFINCIGTKDVKKILAFEPLSLFKLRWSSNFCLY